MTLLLLSHRFSTVRMADLIVVLDGGRVRETGSHAELVAAGGPYAELRQLSPGRTPGRLTAWTYSWWTIRWPGPG